MRSFFVKNILFIIAVNVLVKPIWVLFIDRNVQNTVAGGSYGTYQALLSVSIIFQTILDFGLSSYNSRMIAQNPDRLPELFPSMLSARLILIIIYMCLACTWGFAIGYRGWELNLLVGVLMIQALNALVSFIRSNIAALHKFKTDGILSVTDRLLMILICGFLLTYPPTAHHFKIEWFVITQVVCYFISAVIGYVILRRIGNVKLKFVFNGKTIFAIVKQSFPYALLIFQMSIYNRADMMIMERICVDGKDQAGIYAAAFRLMDMGNMLGLMFATMLLPLFGRMLSEKNDVQPIIKLCVNLLLPFSCVVAIGGIFFSGDIMQLLYHKSPLYNQPGMAMNYGVVFACLIASFPAWCLMYIYSTLLTANGSLKTLNFIAFAGVIINLSLNFLLIPQYKAVGGAITSFITQTGLSLTFIVFAARIIKLPLNVKWLLAHIGYIILVLLLAYAVIVVMRSFPWSAQLAMFSLVCIGLMFVFRFVSVQSIRQLATRRMPER
jgi:O-antigen/teichoic acid export membrane protein